MSNPLSIGSILEGKVTAIKEYGAFVSLPDQKSGLLHISQMAEEYVNKVEDYLSVGDKVQVKVIDITEKGKISLSTKQLAPLKRKDGKSPNKPLRKSNRSDDTSPYQQRKDPLKNENRNSLEDKLKKWMKTSEERIQELQSKQRKK